MKNKKKILVLVLSLVLICSMLFSLVACNNDDGNNNENNALEPTTFATFTFKDDMSAKGQTIKINTDPSVIRDGFTLTDLLKQDTETKYGFKALLSESTWGTSLDGFTGSKIDDLVPKTFEYIAQYSTSASNGFEGAKPITIDGKQYYMSNGIDQVKLTTGVDYLFVIDTYIETSKIYETQISNDPEVYMETSDIVENENNIFLIKCVQEAPPTAEKPTLLKFDKKGDIVASKVLSGAHTYAMPKPLIAGNNIICATPGSIEAFNIDTLEKVWECKEEVVRSSGFPTYYQMELDPQTGIVYIGLCSGEENPGKLIALDTRNGEKSIFDPVDGGYYYYGQSEIVGNYLVTTGINKDGKYTIMSINKNTGFKVDEKLVNDVVAEDIENGFIENKIVYKEQDKSLYYTVSERQADDKRVRVASYVVRTWFDAEKGKFKSSKELKLKGVKSDGEIVFNADRMYITSGNGAYVKTNGTIQVISCDTMKEIYSADIPAVCEGKPLVKKLNKDETLVAFTVNTNEDGAKIKYIIDTPNSTKAYVRTLYSPQLATGYSMSSLLIGNDGTMYYTYQAKVVAFKVKEIA